MKRCIACDMELICTEDDYVQCARCKSYNCVTRGNIEEENRQYFNYAFDKREEYRINKLKKYILKAFLKLDNLLKKREFKALINFEEKKGKCFKKDDKIIEIGFGNGENLVRLLREGYDAFGIDISETASKNFKKRYPEFKSRVNVSKRICKKVDVVYCNALFEHLDKPKQFISNIYKFLKSDGMLVIDSLPIINEEVSDFTVANDINFWKPYHKVIYSVKGLKEVIESEGLYIYEYITHDEFNYRLLSLHLKKGYDKIEELRNTVLRDKRLPNIFEYLLLSVKAHKVKSLTLNGKFILKKRDISYSK